MSAQQIVVRSAQQIVVHAGFHKTGTTAIQSFLSANGKHLWPHMALVLPARIPEISKCATLHSALQDPLSLEEYETRLTTFLHTLDIGKKRHLLISCEDLAGLIPGRNNQEDYATCPALMQATKSAIQTAFGTKIPLTFYMATREPQAWLRSSYTQNLRVSMLKMDFKTYSGTYSNATNFQTILAQLQTQLGDTPLISHPLETTNTLRFGPATPVIDLFNLPATTLDALAPPTRRNTSPPEGIITQMLQINQSGQDPDTCAALKKALLAPYTAP